MKEPIAILGRRHLVRDDVVAVIRQQGGWIHEGKDRVGGIQTTEGAIWFFFDEAETERDAFMESIGDQILGRLGGPYGSSVVLEGSSDAGSAALLTDVAIACCQAWTPAFVYDCADSLHSLDEIIRLRADGRTFLDLHNEWLARIGFDNGQ